MLKKFSVAIVIALLCIVAPMGAPKVQAAADEAVFDLAPVSPPDVTSPHTFDLLIRNITGAPIDITGVTFDATISTNGLTACNFTPAASWIYGTSTCDVGSSSIVMIGSRTGSQSIPANGTFSVGTFTISLTSDSVISIISGSSNIIDGTSSSSIDRTTQDASYPAWNFTLATATSTPTITQTFAPGTNTPTAAPQTPTSAPTHLPSTGTPGLVAASIIGMLAFVSSVIYVVMGRKALKK